MRQSSGIAPTLPPALADAVSSGSVRAVSGPHVNTEQTCRIYSRTDLHRTAWIPDDESTEIVVKDGLEGEGEWLVAMPSATEWTVVRDYWDDREDESTEQVVFHAKTREEAVAYLLTRLLE